MGQSWSGLAISKNAPPQLIPEITSGILKGGAITSDDLTNPLVACLTQLMDDMTSGLAYVVVHTSQNQMAKSAAGGTKLTPPFQGILTEKSKFLTFFEAASSTAPAESVDIFLQIILNEFSVKLSKFFPLLVSL
jgi:hypothetical protein